MNLKGAMYAYIFAEFQYNKKM